MWQKIDVDSVTNNPTASAFTRKQKRAQICTHCHTKGHSLEICKKRLQNKSGTNIYRNKEWNYCGPSGDYRYNPPSLVNPHFNNPLSLQSLFLNSTVLSEPASKAPTIGYYNLFPPPTKTRRVDGVAQPFLPPPPPPPSILSDPEYKIPQEFFIPVPKNVHEVTSKSGRLKIARWALDKALNDLPSWLTYEARQLIGVSWYLSWCLGFVVYKGKKLDMKMELSGLTNMDWDTKVNIFDEPIPNINDNSVLDDLELTYGERCLASRVIQILVSAHIRSFQAGMDVVQAILQDNGQSTVLRDAIDQSGLFITCNMATEKGKQLVANFSGCASPVAVLKYILIKGNRAFHTDLMEVHDVLDNNFGMVKVVDLESLDIVWNLELNIPALGGDARRHEKALTVLKVIAETPMWMIFPHLKEIDAFLKEYTSLQEHPLKYGNNAIRYCGTKSIQTNDLLNKLSPDLGVFVQLHPIPSLFKFFERKYKNHETRHWVEKMEEYAQAKVFGRDAFDRFVRNIPENLKHNHVIQRKVKNSLYQKINLNEENRLLTSYEENIF